MTTNEENISNHDLYNMLKAITKQNEDIKEELKNFKSEIKTEILEIKQHNQQLEQEIINLKDRLIVTERKLKKYNIILYGLSEDDQSDTLEEVVDLINNKLKVKCKKEEIRDAYRIGDEVGDKARPVAVELMTIQLKNRIFTNAHAIKDENIYISQDYTKEDWEKRKLLQENLREARKKKLQATIKKRVLVVEGKEYTYDELLKTPIKTIDFHKENLSEKDKPKGRNKNKRK